MNEQTLSNPTTDEELAKALNKAVHAGDLDEVDRLMAVELPEVETPDEPEPVEEEVVPAESPDDETKIKPSEEVEEVDGKDEAATPEDAASTPDEGEQDPALDVNALQAELHRLRSDVGRMPYLRRRTQELERELRDLQLSRTVGSNDPNAAPNNAKKEIPESLQKRLNALKEIDPDLADTLEETINALRQEAASTATSAVKEVTSAEDARADEEFLQSQYQALVAEVPQAPQVFASPEWKQWKETLSPARRAFAESQYADEVKIAIGAFLNEMQARVQQTNGIPPVQAATTPATPVVPAPVSKVQEARNRKMAGSASTPSSVAAKAGSVEVDENKMFADFYAKIQKENHYK